jgi:hypothetical protein
MSGSPPPGAVPVWGLVLFLAVLAVQRVGELLHSASNSKRLVSLGGR